MKMREISDIEYETALADTYNCRIMSGVCSQFFYTIPSDELYRCKLIGLWKALQANNNDNTFSYVLRNSVLWQCLAFLRQRRYSYNVLYDIPIIHYSYNMVDIQDLIHCLAPHLRNMVKQRFFENMTN